MAVLQLGTLMNDWVKVSLVNAGATPPAIDAYAEIPGTVPPGPLPLDVRWIQMPSRGTNLTDCCVAMMFFGIGTAGNEVGKAWIWGVSADGVSHTAHFIGRLGIVLGTTIGSGSTYPTTNRFATAIRVEIDRSLRPPAIRTVGNDRNGNPMVIFDAMGCEYLIVQLQKTSGVSGDRIAYCTKFM